MVAEPRAKSTARKMLWIWRHCNFAKLDTVECCETRKDELKNYFRYTLRRHNTENSKQIFPGKIATIPTFMSALYIPLIVLPILLKENTSGPNVGHIDRSQTHECGN
jgi:hypothetical protein